MALLDQGLGPLEIVINRALNASPEALAALEGAQDPVALHLRDLGWAFRMTPVSHGVQLVPGDEPARAGVSTSLVGLARLAAGEDPRAMGDALRLQGDAEYAERVLGALRSARIDLQAEVRSLLQPVLGSQFGGQLEQGLRGLLDFGRQSVREILLGSSKPSDDMADNDGQAADPAQTQAWMDEVDDVAIAVDRLEARIRRLETPPSDDA